MTQSALRAHVLADVVRSRPVSATVVGVSHDATRRLVRPRPVDVRSVDGRRVIKATRVGDIASDAIRTVMAVQCGGGKSCSNGFGTETLSGAR